jgi:hypothetical protein
MGVLVAVTAYYAISCISTDDHGAVGDLVVMLLVVARTSLTQR